MKLDEIIHLFLFVDKIRQNIHLFMVKRRNIHFFDSITVVSREFEFVIFCHYFP